MSAGAAASGGGSAARRLGSGLAWISPWLVGFLVFLAFPLYLSFRYSLTDYSILEAPLPIGLENYRELLSDPVFWTVIWNTAVYAVFTVGIGTALAILLAALLNRNIPGIGIFRTAIFVPTLVPLVAAAMVWMWLLNGELGLINAGLRPLFAVLNAVLGTDLRGPSWLEEAAWNMPALVIMSLWMVGRAVVIYLAALQGVPQDMYEAAAIDGMGRGRRFWHVTLPMISPVILFNVIIAIIDAWQVFAVPYVMTRGIGGPEKAMYFYSHYLYDNAFLFGPRMGYACALAWVQLAIVLCLTGLTFWVSRRYVFYRS